MPHASQQATKTRIRPLAALKSRRGSMLAIIAVSMLGILSVMALAADIGAVYLARAEAQRAADAAALAGLQAMIERPDLPGRARQIAEQFAAANTVRGTPVSLDPSDIEFSVMPDTFFQVEVHRTEARGNPIPMFFAGIMGFNTMDVSAVATAAPFRTGTARCFRPFLVVDAWDDKDGDGEFDSGEYYDPIETGYGSDWRHDGYEHDIGRQIILYGSSGGGKGKGNGKGGGGGMHNPSWYGLYSVNGDRGGNAIREQIGKAECDDTPLSVGHVVTNEPGAKTGPVKQGMDELVGHDPDAYWNESTGTVEGSIYGDNWISSPRIGRIALFNPADAPQPGRQDIEISNFITVFIEGFDDDGNLVGRILPTKGEADGCSATGRCAANAWYARLVH